jgi:hypothetical protein
MSTTALTVIEQTTALQTDIKASLEQLFAAIPELTCQRAICDALVTQAKEITVKFNDPEDVAYRNADESCKLLRDTVDEIRAVLDPVVEAFNKAHKAATGLRTQYTGDAENERKRLNGERSAWYQEQERQHRAATLAAQETARLAEQARLLEESRQLEEQGDKQAAAHVLEEALVVEAPAVVLPSFVPQIQGTSFRSVWKWELLDWTKLKPEFVKVNEVAINGTVRANKKAAMTICGEDAIRVFEDKSPIDKR